VDLKAKFVFFFKEFEGDGEMDLRVIFVKICVEFE